MTASNDGLHYVTETQSWTHALAIRRMLGHFGHLRDMHASPDPEEDEYFICIAEFVIWVSIVDQGFELLLNGYSTSSGANYSHLRKASADGQHVIAATWARNKITHCVSRPVLNQAGRLDQTLILGESNLGPDFRWLNTMDLIDQGVNVTEKYRQEPLYDNLFAGKSIYETLVPCVRWLSEVRYDYRDPTWASRWFEAK